MDEAIHARLGAAAATLMPLVEAMRVFAAASGDTARLHVFTISASHDGGAGKVGLARRRKIKAMQGAARRVLENYQPKSRSWRAAAVAQIADTMRNGQETRGFGGAPDG